MRRDLAMLCPTLLSGLLVGALTVVPGCSLNPQPLPPDQAQDSGLANVGTPGSTVDSGGQLLGSDAGKGGTAQPDAGSLPPVVDGGEGTGGGDDAAEGSDAAVGHGDGGNDSADGAADASSDGSHLDAADAADARTPDGATPDAGSTDASQDAPPDGSVDSAI